MQAKWTLGSMPPQTGRFVVITGTGGLGLECALALAGAGADVVIAGRNADKGAEAVARAHDAHPDARVRFMALDLASLASVRAFAAELLDPQRPIDVLINNAGVMAPPTRQITADGFEWQMGVNHLGHFALTAALLPLLCEAHARVVSLSSLAAQHARMDLDDLHAERRYKPMEAYGRSKLACLMFALALQRRSDAAGWGLRSIAAHPGVSNTELFSNGAGTGSLGNLLRRHLGFLFQPAADGALPALFAATSPAARGGMYVGPDGPMAFRGAPVEVRVPAHAHDEPMQDLLWNLSQRCTKARFETRLAARAGSL